LSCLKDGLILESNFDYSSLHISKDMDINFSIMPLADSQIYSDAKV